MREICAGLLLLLVSHESLMGQSNESTIHSRLSKAKAFYASESAKVQEAIANSIDRRLAAARTMGDKSLVEAIELERKTFEEHKDVPPAAPAGLKQRAASLVATMENAYMAAIREFVRSNKDAEAAAVEKELAEFQQKILILRTREVLIGTWTLEMGNYSSDITFRPDGTYFRSRENHSAPWKLNPEKRYLLMYGPGGSDNDAADRVNLPLDPKANKGTSWTGPTFTLTRKPSVDAGTN